jgi:hypothetical protein
VTVPQPKERLIKQLVNLISLESYFEHKLKVWIPRVSAHPEAQALLNNFLRLNRDHQDALETRLTTLRERISVDIESTANLAYFNARESHEYPVSSALQEIYALGNQAVINYAILGSLSSRSLDSWTIEDEGTSAHIALQHINDYVPAIQEISRLINDVVLWELYQEEQECKCKCPSCNLGVCLCSVYWRNVYSTAWEDVGPIANDTGIFVQKPRRGSAAFKTGLKEGDRILNVDENKIETTGDIQNAVRNVAPGEEMRVILQRSSGELEEVTMIKPNA